MSVNISGGEGVPIQPSALDGGGCPNPVLDEGGGVPIQPWMGGGGPNPALDGGGGGYPVSVKGKIFDSRFGLIHVQTGKKIFC